MSRGKAAEPNAGDPIDKIGILPLVEEFFRPGHGEEVFHQLRHQGRYQEGDQHLDRLRPAAQHQQDDDDRHGKKPVSQVGIIDKKNIEGRAVIRVQVKKSDGLALGHQKKEPYEKKEKKTAKKIAVTDKYGF